MITLKEAIKLTRLSDDDICYIRKEGASKYDAKAMSVKEIRNKLDIKNTGVTGISPRFSEFDYRGMEFSIEEEEERY